MRQVNHVLDGVDRDTPWEAAILGVVAGPQKRLGDSAAAIYATNKINNGVSGIRIPSVLT